MTRRTRISRLRAETLESRQMLHGGGLAGAIEPPAPAEIAESVIVANDANEDAMITADEVSERLWNRISAADTDASESVSGEELTVHIEARLVERMANRSGGKGVGRSRVAGDGMRLTHQERLDNFFAENDANEDGVLTEGEVSEGKWERISTADLDGDGVSMDEILGQRQAQRQARFDAAFASMDANDDGGLTVDEVSERRWERISAADVDEDGSVTQQELSDYFEAKRAERESEAEDDGEDADGNGDANVETGQANDAGQRANRRGVRRGRGR